MTDRPIIFSAPMVRALLDGRKTQTRRLATSPLRRCEPGDWLWIKENFIPDPSCDDDAWDDWRMSYTEWAGCGSRLRDVPDALRLPGHCYFAATAHENTQIRWRPSIHMPRWASRLTLIVEGVRVEPLQAISRADAIAEGLSLASNVLEEFWRWPEPHHENLWLSPPAAYRHLWEVLNGPGSWDANPDVLVLTFTVHRQNIDQVMP